MPPVFRTPVAFVAILFYLLIAGFSAFLATTKPVIAVIEALFLVGGVSAVWWLSHRLLVPLKVEVWSDAIAIETRGRGRRLLRSPEYAMSLSGFWRFGAIFYYSTKNKPSRTGSYFLTPSQADYVMSHGLELLTRDR